MKYRLLVIYLKLTWLLTDKTSVKNLQEKPSRQLFDTNDYKHYTYWIFYFTNKHGKFSRHRSQWKAQLVIQSVNPNVIISRKKKIGRERDA